MVICCGDSPRSPGYGYADVDEDTAEALAGSKQYVYSPRSIVYYLLSPIETIRDSIHSTFILHK